MKLGLVGDIHESVELLALAIDRLNLLGVDQFVCLGDVVEVGDQARLSAVLAQLEAVGAVGVWGNHDFGLCVDPTERTRAKYPPGLLASMAKLKPSLVIDDCYLSHIEPRLDPNAVEDLWDCGEHPDTPERAAASFGAISHRVMFMGHHHRWLLVRPGEVLPWCGEGPIVLAPPERYLVVVHAVTDGWCARYDTETGELLPVPLVASSAWPIPAGGRTAARPPGGSSTA